MKPVDFNVRRIACNVVIGSLVVCCTACGTIMHPERKGQVGGRIDPGVAVLNGVGLLFFLIPGVIAYAVDFSNGTIYLPNSSANLDETMDIETMNAVVVDELTAERIREVVQTQVDQPIPANAPMIVRTLEEDAQPVSAQSTSSQIHRS